MTGGSSSRSITTIASPRCLEPGPRRAQVTAMKRCILDGASLPDAAAVYRKLAGDLALPAHFGHNPDALWDALGEQRAAPVRSEERRGGEEWSSDVCSSDLGRGRGLPKARGRFSAAGAFRA